MSSLHGVRVLVLRPEHQASALVRLLEEHGAVPVPIPAIKILPPADWAQIDDAVLRLREFDWIVFTSRNGVESFLSRVGRGRIKTAEGFPERVGAIGPGTRDALLKLGITVDWMPQSFTSAALSEELPDPPANVLLVRADIATTELEDTLRTRRFSVERVDAYRTESAHAEQIRKAVGTVDAVALTSASIARSFAAAAGTLEPEKLPAQVSIGPATTAACRGAGLEVDVEAEEHTIAGLIRALEQHLAEKTIPR